MYWIVGRSASFSLRIIKHTALRITIALSLSSFTYLITLPAKYENCTENQIIEWGCTELTVKTLHRIGYGGYKNVTPKIWKHRG